MTPARHPAPILREIHDATSPRVEAWRQGRQAAREAALRQEQEPQRAIRRELTPVRYVARAVAGAIAWLRKF